MPEPIEVYFVTAEDVLVAFVAWVVVTLAAVWFAVWVLRPRPADTTPAESRECAETVELPRPRSHGPRTGTIHAPQYQRAAANTADDDTVFIEQVTR
ncbi:MULTISPECIES: hypothetical protein [unclassified Micromonospora]|uniref:hypothetical protein n=1 Tax=unclassified Micromonospora TaxID=2617518 RepID=UPI0033202DB4